MGSDERTDWKVTLKSSNLLQKITVNKIDLSDERKIVHEFDSFFRNVGENLASKVQMLLPHSNNL